MFSRFVITALAALLHEAADGVDLRSHRAAGEVALGGQSRSSLTVTRPIGSASGRRSGARPGDVGGDDEHVGLDGAREQGGAEVLVDDRLHAVQGAVGGAHDRDSPPPLATTTNPASTSARTAGASTISSGSGEATTRRQPFSPRSSQVSPWPISTSASSRDR